MTSPKVQICCDSCNTKYNFALPPSVLDDPTTPIRFRCSVCAYRFNIEPDKLLSQQEASTQVIRIQQDDQLYIHQAMSEVQAKLDEEKYRSTDLISAFGSDWSMLSEHPELQVTSPQEEDVSDTSVFEDAFDDEPEEVEEPEDLSSEQQDWSQLDPFSESEEANSNVIEDSVEDESESLWSEDSIIADQEEFIAEENSEPVEQSDVSDDEEEYEHSIYDEIYQPDEPEEDTHFGFEEDTKYEEEDIQTDSERFQWYDTPDEPPMDEENMLDEVQPTDEQFVMDGFLEEQQEEDVVESVPPFAAQEFSQEKVEEQTVDISKESEISEEEPYKEVNFLDEDDLEKSITAAIEEADFQQANEEFSLVDGKDAFLEEMDAEIEYEEESEEESEEVEVEPDDDLDSEEEQPEKEGGSERLSFHDKDDYLDAEEIKKELNPMWILAVLLLSAIGILAYMNSRKNPEYADVKGVETNPEQSSADAEPNKGLQDDKDPQKESSSSEGEGQPSTGGENQPPEQPSDDDLNIEKDETVDDISRRGWQALNTDNPEVAIQLFKAVLRRQPDHFYSSAGLGRAYEARGQVELAGRQYCNAAGIPSIDYDDMQYWLGYAEQVGTFCQ